MRLINNFTLEIEEFEGQNVPPYAILSHRWEEEEVLYKDMDRGTAVTKKGWKKITKCCQQALSDGLKYAWIDTCCIDKSSSAELSETINSMFRWYQYSKVCYVYLCDVHLANSTWQEWESLYPELDKWSNITKKIRQTFLDRKPEFSEAFAAEFCNSVWFTRGWTLQELLASNTIAFFGHNWQMLGTKDFLRSLISHVTRIRPSILMHKVALDAITVAERMSWAAKRETTRIEDRAYSLMGIFGVSMSTLYGEGEAAFRRLQEEILKWSNDQSILFSESPELNLLATSPADFETHLPEPVSTSVCKFQPFSYSNSTNYVSYHCFPEYEASALTNAGLSIKLHLIPWFLDIYLVPLELYRTTWHGRGLPLDEIPHIFLKRQIYDTRLYRVRFQGKGTIYFEEGASSELSRLDNDPPKRQCVIAYKNLTQDSATPGLPDVHYSTRINLEFYGARFSFEHNKCWGPYGSPQSCDVIARQEWSPVECSIEFAAGSNGVLAIFRTLVPSGKHLYMFVGFNQDFDLCIGESLEFPWNFDEIVEAGVDSNLAVQALDMWKFDEITSRDADGRKSVKKGLREPYKDTIHNTAIPGVRLTILRTDAYAFDFQNYKI